MEVNKIDKSNMRQVIVDSPNQLRDGLELAKNINIEGDFKNIIVCGMGGSSLPADIAQSLNIHLCVHKDYNLPFVANEKSLVICISYSGNTEETVSALQEALAKKITVIGIASGGKIEQLCQQNDLPFIKIPTGIQPRSAIGYIFSALMKILANLKMTSDTSSEILETAKELESINSSLEKEGKILAKKLYKKIPILYGTNSSNAISIARIWKIKFNENSKIPAFYNYFPELNHNEMVGYSDLKKMGFKNFCVLIFKDSSSRPRILKRIDLTANIIKKAGAKAEILSIKEGSETFKIFSSLLLGDWTSYYLALEYKTDPTPVKIVEEFKDLMQK